MRMQDKVAIVTGGARGIGFGCAKVFVSEGAKVVIGDVRVEDGRKAAAALTKAGPGEAIFVKCDVARPADVQKLVDTGVAKFGKLDVAVANAGINRMADFLDMALEQWNEVLKINLTGVFLTNQYAARQMAKQGTGGAIINMSSVNAVMAIPTIPAYVASKGGINQLTKVAALSLATKGIRVNAIGPGSISTEMARMVAKDPAVRHAQMARTPLGRYGEPEEIGRIALFLATEDSSYMTGQVLYPDGGRMALNYTVPVVEDAPKAKKKAAKKAAKKKK
jgi:NAD(P)-dependent dehydrogenase (short-subunit alcohol dehydrogenase family)